MKRSFIFIYLFVCSSVLLAKDEDFSIDYIEPPFWWTGMKNQNLQLVVYGHDITFTSPEIFYEGVSIKKVSELDNPNYLFLDIIIDGKTKPGIFDIQFIYENEQVITYEYQLKRRREGSSERKGFDKTDVIYLLMPDRFSNGNVGNDNVEGMLEQVDRNNPDGRHGGDIEGIINHLDYFSELGVTTLWINPLVENNNPNYSYHGYAVTDFFKIDPRFGSNEDYVKLVDKCHESGLKVIMDMIFNHASIHNRIIKDLPSPDWIHQFPKFTKSNFRGSTIMDPHASEFDRIRMLTGWFDEHMADLDQRNEFLAKYLIQNTIWWIEYSGIDGIRVDTQPYSYKEFISSWSEAVFAEYPQFNIVGETWLQKESVTSFFQKDPVYPVEYNSNIPCITDFPLYYAISKAFNEKDGWSEGLSRLYYVLAQDFLYSYPENNLVFCDNHDLNRYFTTLGEDLRKWKMGMVFLMTTRGIPMLYYGTEILMTGEEHKGHGFIRKDFPGGWKDDEFNAFIQGNLSNGQFEAYYYLQKLLYWRKYKDVIHYGKLKHFVPEDETYVYFRYNDTDCVMVAFNNSNNEIKAIKTDRFMECMNGYTYGINVLTDETLHYIDAITIQPKSALIIELKK